MLILANLLKGLFFNQNDGGGKTPDDDSEGKDKKAEEKDKGKDKSSQKSEDDKDETKAKDEKKFTQADVELIVKERLERERKKTEKDADEARKKAEEDALTKNNEYKQLSEKRQETIVELEKQLDELTTIKANAEKYQGALNKYLSEAKKNLPKHVLPLVEKLDVVEALEYIAANAKELGVTVTGIPETPKEKDKKLSDDDKQKGKSATASVIRKSY